MSEAITKALQQAEACIRWLTFKDASEFAGTPPKASDTLALLKRALSQAGQGEAYTVVDMGFGKWEVGAGTNAGAPCIAFGVHGGGKVGELITIEPRQMSVEETHAVITFANYEGFAVLQEKMDEVRALHFSAAQPAPVASAAAQPDHTKWPPIPMSHCRIGQQTVPAGMQLVPEYRGYAHLGVGMYTINHSKAGTDPELVISIATEAEKAGRKVGEERDNEPGRLIQPEQMAVRIGFENVAGLDALESQLRYVREVHFSAAPKPEQAAVTVGPSLLRQPVKSVADISKTIPGGCYCPPGTCQAPVIMGRQTPCLRRAEDKPEHGEGK